MTPADRLCLALDVPDLDAAVGWVSRTRGAFSVYKIGLQLFCAAGRRSVEAVRAAGAPRVFLDLKLHDIPNTVAGAVCALGDAGVDLLTVHTGGGRAMLEAAVAAAAPTGLRLLGVTVLTSLDGPALAAIGVSMPPADAVLQRARLAIDAGVSGLVCSPREVAAVRAAVGPRPTLVTPGIRLAGMGIGDQRRVATPAAAVAGGADLLVIGRAVTTAPDTDTVLEALHRELA